MKTKDRIANTMINLLKEEEFKEIQINEISNLSGYNRKTIQRHFNGKEGVLEYYLGEIIDDFRCGVDENNEIEVVLLFFEYLYSYKSLILLLKRRSLVGILEKVISQKIRKEMDIYLEQEKLKWKLGIEEEYIINMTIYQVVAIFKTWLEHNFDDDVEEVKKIIRKSIENYEG